MQDKSTVSPDEWTEKINQVKFIISHLAYIGELCYMCPRAKKNRKLNKVTCTLMYKPYECISNQMYVNRLLNKSEEYYINEKNTINNG